MELVSRNTLFWREIGSFFKKFFAYPEKNKQYMLYAKTEYKDDWEFVYDQLIHTGKAPRRK